MNILDTPFVVEFFFGFSTVIFLLTLYTVLPALIYNKRTLAKPSMISGLWRKYINAIFIRIKNIVVLTNKKETIRTFLTVNSNIR